MINGDYADHIKNISLDAGYIAQAIYKEVSENKQTPYILYKRPLTKREFFKKYDHVYDKEYDCYICPNAKILNYTTTTRKGYRQYKSDQKNCKNCPFRNQCVRSQNHMKVMNRHLWEKYREQANEIRYTPEWKEIYPQKKKQSNKCLRTSKKITSCDLPS